MYTTYDIYVYICLYIDVDMRVYVEISKRRVINKSPRVLNSRTRAISRRTREKPVLVQNSEFHVSESPNV